LQRNPVGEYCTLGSVRGVPGNRRPHREDSPRNGIAMSVYTSKVDAWLIAIILGAGAVVVARAMLRAPRPGGWVIAAFLLLLCVGLPLWLFLSTRYHPHRYGPAGALRPVSLAHPAARDYSRHTDTQSAFQSCTLARSAAHRLWSW